MEIKSNLLDLTQGNHLKSVSQFLSIGCDL